MPNYPEITLNNPYLMSRTDDSIIDAHHYGMEVRYYAIHTHQTCVTSYEDAMAMYNKAAL